jgi:hypothetical protein
VAPPWTLALLVKERVKELAGFTVTGLQIQAGNGKLVLRHTKDNVGHGLIVLPGERVDLPLAGKPIVLGRVWASVAQGSIYGSSIIVWLRRPAEV